MVIEYKSFTSRLPIRGVYLADPSIDHNLREVEPPAHTTWDNTGSHDVSERSKEIARGVLSRIRRSVKEFAAEFAPPPTTVATDLPLFGDILGRYMGGRTTGPRPTPEGKASGGPAIGIRVIGPDIRELQSDGRIVLRREISIRIPDEERWNGALLKGKFGASIAQDLAGTASGSIALHVSLPVDFSEEDGAESFSGSVRSGQDYSFAVWTEPFARNLSILIAPAVELIGRDLGGVANG